MFTQRAGLMFFLICSLSTFFYSPIISAEEIKPESYDYIFEKDNQERLKKITNPDGSITTYHYNENNKLERVEDSKIGKIRYEYKNNLLSKLVYPSGYEFKFEYYDNGNVEKTYYPDGTTMSYKYVKGDLISKVHSDFGTLTYEYDESRNLKSVVDTDGNRFGFDLDKDENLKSITYPSGEKASEIRFTYTWSESGKLDKVTSPFETFFYRYDKQGKLTSTMDYRGIKTIIEYDDNNITPNASFSPFEYTKYDEHGNPVQSISADGLKIQWKWRDKYYVESVANPIDGTQSLGASSGVSTSWKQINSMNFQGYNNNAKFLSVKIPSQIKLMGYGTGSSIKTAITTHSKPFFNNLVTGAKKIGNAFVKFQLSTPVQKYQGTTASLALGKLTKGKSFSNSLSWLGTGIGITTGYMAINAKYQLHQRKFNNPNFLQENLLHSSQSAFAIAMNAVNIASGGTLTIPTTLASLGYNKFSSSVVKGSNVFTQKIINPVRASYIKNQAYKSQKKMLSQHGFPELPKSTFKRGQPAVVKWIKQNAPLKSASMPDPSRYKQPSQYKVSSNYKPPRIPAPQGVSKYKPPTQAFKAPSGYTAPKIPAPQGVSKYKPPIRSRGGIYLTTILDYSIDKIGIISELDIAISKNTSNTKNESSEIEIDGKNYQFAKFPITNANKTPSKKSPLLKKASRFLRTGNFVYNELDFCIEKVEDLCIGFYRFYNSFRVQKSEFGYGWTPFPYALKPNASKLEILLHDNTNGKEFNYLLSDYQTENQEEIVFYETNHEAAPILGITNNSNYVVIDKTNDILFTFDLTGKLVAQEIGNITLSYLYNENGLSTIKSSKESNEKLIKLNYDRKGRIINAKAEEKTLSHYTYNPFGDLFSRSLPNKKIVYYYEKSHLLSQIISESNNEQDIALDYDDNGRIFSKDQNGTKIVMQYNDKDNIIKVTGSDNEEIEYKFNNNEEISAITWPDKRVTVFSYGIDGKLYQVANGSLEFNNNDQKIKFDHVITY